MKSSRGLRGFTLLEALVTMGIVGILLSLLVPAIQAARESSRRTECGGHLRQIGLALQSYESTYRCFPQLSHTSVKGELLDGTFDLVQSQISAYAHLLPWIGGGRAFEECNFSQYALLQNVRNVDLPVFHCPSDGGKVAHGANCNLVLNGGSTVWILTTGLATANGAFETLRTLSTRDFVDGLAKTAAVSERIVGDDLPRIYDPKRDVLRHQSTSHQQAYAGGEQFSAECNLVDPLSIPGGHSSEAGRYWILFGLGQTSYNHFRGPNSVEGDCVEGDGEATSSAIKGIIAPRSNHPGGVHVLSMDGSLHFVGNSIDLLLWRAIGTRNGGEPLDGIP